MRYAVNLRECSLDIIDGIQTLDALTRQHLVLQMQVAVAMTAVEALNGYPTTRAENLNIDDKIDKTSTVPPDDELKLNCTDIVIGRFPPPLRAIFARWRPVPALLGIELPLKIAPRSFQMLSPLLPSANHAGTLCRGTDTRPPGRGDVWQ